MVVLPYKRMQHCISIETPVLNVTKLCEFTLSHQCLAQTACIPSPPLPHISLSVSSILVSESQREANLNTKGEKAGCASKEECWWWQEVWAGVVAKQPCIRGVCWPSITGGRDAQHSVWHSINNARRLRWLLTAPARHGRGTQGGGRINGSHAL